MEEFENPIGTPEPGTHEERLLRIETILKQAGAPGATRTDGESNDGNQEKLPGLDEPTRVP